VANLEPWRLEAWTLVLFSGGAPENSRLVNLVVWSVDRSNFFGLLESGSLLFSSKLE
jgi:hypothetical protein